MVESICGLIGPLAGQTRSPFACIPDRVGCDDVHVVDEREQGGRHYGVLRTGLALAVLINLFTLPTLVGLQPLNCGSGF